MPKEYAKLGNGEFGECYHAVLARLLNKEFFLEFIDFNDAKVFCETVADCPEVPNSVKKVHLGVTANWIWQHFHEGIQQDALKKINLKAKKEEWLFPNEFSQHLSSDKKLLIWLRTKTYKSHRNISLKAIDQIESLCKERNTMPLFVGPKIAGMKDSSIGIWDFYKNDWIKKSDSIAKQLWILNQLYISGGVLGSIGMMSGAMDGLAFYCGRKVLFIARKEDVTPRMLRVSSSVPQLNWIECYYNQSFEGLGESSLGEIDRKIWGEQVGI